ncbi:leukocyte elastase inhibitor-like [Synchiropus splendidus]|uniref:leukocyte elastase inhibitor-like n=1 Tax=Synchiropus splendidus TaxID=270530 RepID=UPI00237DE913|nr:leukocyte elastase inhibitor-like [Synchiropus splendidus]XP_053706415.1 leukocyte elastase inhibitor-like [Synchiropus splendidus]XP_053706510.1 leukocyte elastase inhibitor-like [Synchiropus splendidus]XP_053706597.1 leukocyte elastase inhibitor-like [Synchiropus splendidus]
MDLVSGSNNSFSLDLFRTLSRAQPGQNLFISPLSISSAMAMVYQGARGDTAAQMAQALSFTPGQDVHGGFQSLNSQIRATSSSCTLKLANRLFGERSLGFLPEFLDSTQKFYQAELKPLDFMGAAEESRAEINGWVEQQTESKIQELLQPGAITPTTRLALVNALYFKGDWMWRFGAADTREMPFHSPKDGTKPVQMMHQVKKMPYNYVPELELQVLELPYQSQELSMFVLLPEKSSNGSDPLLKVQDALTPEKLEEWTSREAMDAGAEVHVHLPRFRLEDQHELKEPLAQLGMRHLFCADTADLSGICGQGGLFLSTVVHKTLVEVNEEGSEAVGASAAVASFCMLREEHFMADHPFLFFIKHHQSKAVLFMGRFSSPQ